MVDAVQERLRSDEQEQEDDNRDRNCFSWDKFCTVYHTRPTVRLRTKALKVPYIIINIILFSFIFIWELGYKLRLLQDVTSEGSATVWVSEPKSNFWTCSNIDTDCEIIVKKDADLDYCKPQHYKDKDVEGCDHYDRHVVAGGKFTHQIFIATAIMTFEQEKKESEVQWHTTRNQTKYVKGVEDYMLTIRHSFFTAEHFASHNNFESQGFLVYRGKEETTPGQEDPLLGKILKKERLACSSFENGTMTVGHCHTGFNWHHIPECHASLAFSRHEQNPTCMKTIYGDYLSVEKVLEAAGAGALDDKNQDYGKPLRLMGTALVMDIVIHNDDPADFWCWPLGRKLKYYYAFYEIKIDPGHTQTYTNFFYRDTIVEHHGFEKTKRTLRQLTGIPIFIRTHVHYREFSMFRGIVSCLVCISAMLISRVIVEKILVKIYRYLGHHCTGVQADNLGHVSLSFSYFTKRETPCVYTMGSKIHDGDFHAVQDHEKEHIQKMLLERDSLSLARRSRELQ